MTYNKSDFSNEQFYYKSLYPDVTETRYVIPSLEFKTWTKKS